jgi:hypothetical protein
VTILNYTSAINASGTSGTSGISGSSGTSATSGTSGTSGTAGTAGSSGTSGTTGTSGTSGTSGSSGTSGTSATSGTSGTSGTGFDSVQNTGITRILTSDGTSNGVIAQSGITYNSSGSTFVIYGTEYQRSVVATSITSGTTAIVTIPTSSGCSADFNYCVTESAGAKRAGTVKSVWNSSTAGYTDVSTTDISGSTTNIGFTVTVSGSNVNLNAVVSGGTWSVLVASKILF